MIFVKIIEYTLKYINHIICLYSNLLNIHLIWLIDEYAINFRIEVWFRPPIAPKIADKIILKYKILLIILYEIIIIGAIFCHDIKSNELFQFNPSITIGSQKWNGEAPIFNKSDIKINLFINVNSLFITKIIDINIIDDANVWIRKYFNEASDDINLLFLIRGIKDNKLISNPIHIVIHELEEIIKMVLIVKINMKINFDELFIIKKKRIRPL